MRGAGPAGVGRPRVRAWGVLLRRRGARPRAPQSARTCHRQRCRPPPARPPPAEPHLQRDRLHAERAPLERRALRLELIDALGRARKRALQRADQLI
jgi:hypothetical protein